MLWNQATAVTLSAKQNQDRPSKILFTGCRRQIDGRRPSKLDGTLALWDLPEAIKYDFNLLFSCSLLVLSSSTLSLVQKVLRFLQ